MDPKLHKRHTSYTTLLAFLVTSLCLLACKKNTSGDPGNEINPAASTGGGIIVSDTSQLLGVNYNESFQDINFGELARTKTKWVRGFIDVFLHYDNNDLVTNPRIVSYVALKDSGYKTVLNLKFNFITRPYPAVNSNLWNSYIAFLDKILDRVIAKTDVIVVGNEPFIESETSNYDEPLNSFYKAAANRVNDYLKTHNLQRPIFVGSFDNIYQGDRQTATGVLNLLNFVKNTSWIAGIDLHIHHTDVSEIGTVLNFVNDKIRSNQRIIVTEYSLMKWWRSHLNDDLSSDFIAAANVSASDNIYPPPPGVTKVWQYIDYALKNPRKMEEWNAFHQNTPWLETRKVYLCNSYKAFKANPKFWLATYAAKQSYPFTADFTSNTDPWILNSLFTGRTVQLMSNREAEGRYYFLNQFADMVTTNTTCQ
jgi:hypothetical protein